MTSSEKKIPPIIKSGVLLLCLIVFAVGFWHTHLGLKEMRPFESDYGSILIASIILLMLLISYFFAVSGKKVALVFYLICACFFIVFNLNFFYPSYLGRQLVKEEAIRLNNTLHAFSNKETAIDRSDVRNDWNNLRQLKEQILDEINYQSGFGPVAKRILHDFNTISGRVGVPPIDPSFKVGNTNEDRKRIADFLDKQMNNAMKDYILKGVSENNKENAEKLYLGTEKLDSINRVYTPILKEIIADDSRISLHDVKNHPQIVTLQHLVTDLDDAATKINEGSNTIVFPKLEEAKTRNLGRIAHTLSSIRERIGHIDTWAMILLCVFIDLLVPLAIYILIRQNEFQARLFPVRKGNRPKIL